MMMTVVAMNNLGMFFFLSLEPPFFFIHGGSSAIDAGAPVSTLNGLYGHGGRDVIWSTNLLIISRTPSFFLLNKELF